MNCIARSALKGKLPAIGSVLDRGSYEIATGSQVKVGEYFAAIIVSPIIGASWSVVALILAAVSGHWNDAQRLATFAGVLGTIVFLCLLWPKKKDP